MTCLSAPHLTGVAPCVTVCVILLSQIPPFFSSNKKIGMESLHPVTDSIKTRNVFFPGGGGVFVCLFCFCIAFFFLLCVCVCVFVHKSYHVVLIKKNNNKDKIRISCRWF